MQNERNSNRNERPEFQNRQGECENVGKFGQGIRNKRGETLVQRYTANDQV